MFRPPTSRDKRLFSSQMLIAVAATVVVIGRSSSNGDSTAFYLGAVVCILSMLPLIIWSRTMEYNYPVFELFMATNLTSYGIPLMSEKNAADIFDDNIRSQAAIAVILFQIITMVVFYSVRGQPKRTEYWLKPVFQDLSQRWMINGLIISSVYVVVVQFYYFPDASIAGILRAVFFGISTSCVFIVGMAWGLGQLKQNEKTTIIICILIQFLVTSISLVLRTGVSIILLGLVGYFFGARRLPLFTVALTLAVCAILNIGKYDLRGQYWFGDSKKTPDLEDIPSFYLEWFSAGLAPQAKAEGEAGTMLLERNSLLQMQCLVMSWTPERRPFLNGLTYEDIPGQFVPRILWPDKPKAHVSTTTLSIYYGLQDEEASGSTTIAFGMLPEGYANFGMMGMVLLALVFGITFKLILVWSKDSPIFSYPGLMLILLTAWSFQTELTMAIWITSMFQGAVSVIAFVYLFRRLQEIMT